jgi:hypothetical protein
MHTSAAWHDELEQQSRDNRQREADAAFKARYASEKDDRQFIRKALSRDLPDDEIESRLAMTTRFVQLYPGRDVRSYVRGLIEEEKSSFHALSSQAPPFNDSLPAPTTPCVDRMPQSPKSEGAPDINSRVQATETTVRDYINESFRSDDWLAILARNRNTGETLQRISPVRTITSPEYRRWLRHLNASGSDIYVSLNTFKEHARGRTKEDLKEIRHLYLDLDEGGAQKLETIRRDDVVPAPNYILNTSPGKFQVIWRVEAIGQEQTEEMLRTLAQRYGGDPAATDSTRVFRLPGFNNKKYDQDFQVTISREAPAHRVYRASDFALPGQEQDRTYAPPAGPSAPPQASPNAEKTQSEKDWAYAIRKLKAGEDPHEIISKMARYRSMDQYDKKDPKKLIAEAKPRPYYYAEQTVTKAMTSLGMTKRPAPPADSGASSRETETAPSR